MDELRDVPDKNVGEMTLTEGRDDGIVLQEWEKIIMDRLFFQNGEIWIVRSRQM